MQEFLEVVKQITATGVQFRDIISDRQTPGDRVKCDVMFFTVRGSLSLRNFLLLTVRNREPAT